MATIGAGVSLKGIPHDEWHYPFLLDAAVTIDDIGKPMTMSADMTMEVAGDGARIDGWLVSFEDRTIEGIKVGTISVKGPKEFPYTTGDSVAVGDTVVGGTNAGEVKKKPLVTDSGGVETVDIPARNLVVSKDATAETVVVILL